MTTGFFSWRLHLAIPAAAALICGLLCAVLVPRDLWQLTELLGLLVMLLGLIELLTARERRRGDHSAHDPLFCAGAGEQLVISGPVVLAYVALYALLFDLVFGVGIRLITA